MLYLDHNATTPPHPAVADAMRDALLECWGNPSSKHGPGQAAKALLAEARTAVAALCGAMPVEVVFTSGATEANQSVLAGVVLPGEPVPTVALSAIEHAGFLKAATAMHDDGRIALTRLPVDQDGRIRLDVAEQLIRPGCRLVSVMAANNETGVLQPIAEIATITRAAGALLHVDATQLVGKLPFDFHASAADFASLSAHKLHGPKGSGALLIRKGLGWPALICGTQERHRRGGTENLPGIVGFGVAARLARAAQDAAPRVAAVRDALEAGLCERLPVAIWGRGAPRLPNTSLLRVGTLHSDLVLDRLERNGIAAASGSACSSGGQAASHVLTAMGVQEAQAHAAVRLSLGMDASLADARSVVDVLADELRPHLADAA